MPDSLNVSAKQRLVAAARRVGALPLLEAARFVRASSESREENRAFRKAHPDFAAPPLWWMHDMYSHTSYDRYLRSGEAAAAGLAARIDRHVAAARPRVADWGCGLARVTRHLPARYQVAGFDRNRAAVAWCQRHVPAITFKTCDLAPPLPAADNAFDALIAISVFTHLSEAGHRAWIGEIARVLAPGGVFLGAFHTAPPADQLFEDERRRFDAGALVVRGGVGEGSRIYTAFHPPAYLRETLLAGFEIVEGPVDFFGQGLICARKI